VAPHFLERQAALLYEAQDFGAAATVIEAIAAQTQLTAAQARLGADIAAVLGDHARAAALAHQAVPADARDYRDHLWQAKLLARCGQPDQAEQVLRNLTKKSPTIPEVWVALVQRLAQSGKKWQAAEVMSQVAKQVPPAQVKLTLARCHEALGELPEAEKLFRENAETQSHAFMGWKHLAEFHLRHKEYGKAEPWLRKLLDPAYRVPVELTQAARRQLAVALARQGGGDNYHRALGLLQPGNKSPESAADRTALALVLATRPSQRSQAIALLEQVHHHQPLAAEDALALAVLYRQENQPEKASQVLQRLLALHGQTPEYLAEHVRCLLDLREVADAGFYLHRLQELQPTHPQLPALQKQLKGAVKPPE
jgi:tetratricopeptide (TPR) repeat protein